MSNTTKSLQFSLLSMRLTVFLVMAIWTLDKFVNPEHAAAIYDKFYFLPGLQSTVILGLGALEGLLLLGFLLGIAKTWTYGIVLALHAVSTFSAFPQYLSPFEGANLLFFAAWPMFAACLSLFLMREQDQLLTLARWRANS